MKKFAEQLGRHINSSGVKQTYVATSTGISYNYLQRLLSGNRNPSDQVVYKLAESLHLSPEQTGELLAAAGYAPSLALLQSTVEHPRDNSTLSAPPAETSAITRLAQQFYKLTYEIPEEYQSPFIEEMKHFLGYARYKYVLSGNADLLDMSSVSSFHAQKNNANGEIKQHHSHLDLIAELVGKLYNEPKDESVLAEEASYPPQAMEDMLSAIDQLIGNILASGITPGNYQSEVIVQTFEMLQQGTPWEIRRRIAEALPSLFRLNIAQAERLMETLRLDSDEVRGVDIRRRVVEALPNLLQLSPHHLPTILRLLQPKPGDDIYVALATVEASEDIQACIKQLLNEKMEASVQAEMSTALLRQMQAKVSKIQRQLLLKWNGVEKESLQYSLALHNLLRAPDTLLISLNEGLQSNEKLLQLVAARYIEYVLPARPVEALELYRMLLHITRHRNVRRAVAKALPVLLQSLKEASLPARALTREVISDLAVDPDLYIRRAVADHAMHIFHADREFLLVLLHRMHEDTDRVIRHRLQPVALSLAQVWLTWYAETAGLVDAKQSRHKTALPFGE
jgi:transcriptional regulator with XRE-family HTH domain